MKKSQKVFSLLIAMLITVISTSGAFQGPDPLRYSPSTEHEDKTLSPYFYIESDGPETERLPLKSTRADVNISGVIADVTVTQEYKNEGGSPIEAIYIFPASTRAAIYGMKMTIGERVIQAEIKKRDEARKDYEQAKNQGKSASLLEQQRPNVFQMNVANIMPGDVIKVELKYTELLVPTDKIYEFVYPTVVGPRYSNLPEGSTEDKWIENPYLHEGVPPTYNFDIHVNISAGMPIHKVHSTSHKLDIQFKSISSAVINLDSSEMQGGNRDFILRYGLAGKSVDSGLLLYRGEKENFFLLMMQPPERVKESDIPGREYIFVVDVSGSMNGFPLEVSKELLRNLIGNLRPSDRFNVLLFAASSSVMSKQSLPATEANIMKAINHINNQRGGGGTEILPALKRALALPPYEDYSRTIVIATDGYVRVEEETFDLIRNNLGNANMFAFGIGSSVNRHLIEGMAHSGMGEPFVITHPDKAAAEAEKLRRMIQSPVLTNVKVDFGGFETYDVEPLSIPDVLADRPVILFGKWKGNPKGRITLSGQSGSGEWLDSIEISRNQEDGNSALQYLWARERIKILSDYNKLSLNDERVREVTSLGLTYSLLTEYTSFVAVDSKVRNEGGQSTTVAQPLPLPQGVSDYAVVSSIWKPGRMQYSSAPAMAQEMLAESKMKRESKIHIQNLSVTGGLSEEDILKELKKRLQDINSCSPFPQSTKLDVKLTFDSRGNVQNITITRGGFKNGRAEKCIEKIISKFSLAQHTNGKRVQVTFEIVFK